LFGPVSMAPVSQVPPLLQVQPNLLHKAPLPVLQTITMNWMPVGERLLYRHRSAAALTLHVSIWFDQTYAAPTVACVSLTTRATLLQPTIANDITASLCRSVKHNSQRQQHRGHILFGSDQPTTLTASGLVPTTAVTTTVNLPENSEPGLSQRLHFTALQCTADKALYHTACVCQQLFKENHTNFKLVMMADQCNLVCATTALPGVHPSWVEVCVVSISVLGLLLRVMCIACAVATCMQHKVGQDTCARQ
jgi:hypothetical protein